MVIKQNVKRNMEKCDYIINPVLEKPHRSFNKKNVDELYEIGYFTGLDFVEKHFNY